MKFYKTFRGSGCYYTTEKPPQRTYGGRYTKEETIRKMHERRLKINRGKFILYFN
jgi:hypothetical protein